ncbi:hypothetical protein A1140_01855 [Staphylococcus felis]
MNVETAVRPIRAKQYEKHRGDSIMNHLYAIILGFMSSLSLFIIKLLKSIVPFHCFDFLCKKDKPFSIQNRLVFKGGTMS